MNIKNELTNIKVVQHNDLVTSIARMDRVPLKFFELAVSALDTENPPEDRTVYLKKSTLYDFFDSTGANRHTKLKNTLSTLHKEVTFYMEKELEDGSLDSQLISSIGKTNWNSVKDNISITFTEEIMPYLIAFKRNFTQYLISDISNLESKYSIIIYKLLHMYYGQYLYYKDKKNRTTQQLDEWKNPQISLLELRKVTDTTNTYKYLSNFEKRVLKLAIDEINEHTSILVDYKKVRFGRSIGAIQFFITDKNVAENTYYKEEQQDPSYLAGKKKKEIEFEEKYAAAQRNQYTEMLMDFKLISFTDMWNKDLMVELNETVYPHYTTLEKLTGKAGVIAHLEHVKKYKEDYTHENKPKYLRKSIAMYLKNQFKISVE